MVMEGGGDVTALQTLIALKRQVLAVHLHQLNWAPGAPARPRDMRVCSIEKLSVRCVHCCRRALMVVTDGVPHHERDGCARSHLA